MERDGCTKGELVQEIGSLLEGKKTLIWLTQMAHESRIK